ncbi:MAG TPA: branched-chain amino acid ABC transporter permease [Acidimicrobiia bacterium]|nr:branched-chain amino acid ABC transporter permease [Acidimicrobiia bacterium]
MTAEPTTVALPPSLEPVADGRGTRRIFITIVVLALALVPVARFLPAYNYILQLGISGLMWIALTSSWNILGGYTGYISLGHNVFFAIGGYLSGMLLVYQGLSPFLTAVLGGALAFLVGLVAGLITLRTRGPAFIISTVALLLVITLWLDSWELAGGSNGLSLPLPPFPIQWLKVPFYYAMFVAAVGAVFLGYRVQHSKLGLALRAIAQDEVKAEVAGVNTRRLKILAFALSAFFPGVVGAIFGYNLSYIRPTVFLIIGVAAQMVLMAIIGGRGTVAGPVIGAVLIVALNELSLVYFGATELNIVITGAIMIVVLLFFPGGIVGYLREKGKLPAILDWD